jgi:phage terminase large subunit-like protein
VPWDLSRPDWRERIVAGRSLLPDLPDIDRDRARRATAIFDRLRIPDVPDQPTFGEAAGDWFREIVGALHGSIDRLTGKRRIEGLFNLIPKKNSKTTNAAGLMLTSLLINERPRAEFLVVSATQHIADTGMSQIEGMIEADKGLQDRLKVQTHIKKVTHRVTKATLRVKSFSTNVLTGVKPSGALVDELHLLGEIADADRVIGQLRGGLISQPEGFLAFITTQSERPPAGVFKAELSKARAIRDGRASGTMLPILYEFPEEYVKPVPSGEIPRWYEVKLWPMVTPNNGRSITVARLAADFEDAKLSGDEEIRRWASQHLNIEIGLALRSDRWSGADHWESRGSPELLLDDIIERSEVMVVGIDGGGLDDLLGLAILGRDRATREWLLWSHAWAHQSVLERRKSEAPRLKDLVEEGSLTLVPKLGEDIAEVVDHVHRVRQLLPEKNAIGVDPAGIGQIVDELAAREISTEQIVGIPQGWKLNGAILTTERKLLEGTLSHGGTALMNYAVGNAKVEPKGNAVSITKQASGRAKIDPLMAAFNAVALMAMNPDANRSVYEERGLIVFG